MNTADNSMIMNNTFIVCSDGYRRVERSALMTFVPSVTVIAHLQYNKPNASLLIPMYSIYYIRMFGNYFKQL